MLMRGAIFEKIARVYAINRYAYAAKILNLQKSLIANDVSGPVPSYIGIAVILSKASVWLAGKP